MAVLPTTMQDLRERSLTSPHIHAMLTFHASGVDLDQALALTVLAMEEALTASMRAHGDLLMRLPVGRDRL
jgi:hypothetical protein